MQSQGGLSTAHTGGMVVGVGDGSVRMIQPNIGDAIWYAVWFNPKASPSRRAGNRLGTSPK